MASSSTGKRTWVDDLTEALECKVCMETMETPKSLQCGHSVCDKCEPGLWKGGGIVCPFCRKKTKCKKNDPLPVNYGLMNVIAETKKEAAKEKENDTAANCSSCSKRAPLDSLFRCDQNGCEQAIICCKCSTVKHKGHAMVVLEDVVEEKKKDIRRWIDTSQMKERLEKARTEETSNGATMNGFGERCYALIRSVRDFEGKLKRDNQENGNSMQDLQADFDDFASFKWSPVTLCASDLPAKFAAFEKRLDGITAKRAQLSAKLTESVKALDAVQSDVTRLMTPPVQAQAEQVLADAGGGTAEQQGGDGDQPVDKIKVTVVGQDSNKVHFQIKFDVPMEKLKKAYADRTGNAVDQLRFLFDGRRIADTDTPRSLAMEEDDLIEVYQEL